MKKKPTKKAKKGFFGQNQLGLGPGLMLDPLKKILGDPPFGTPTKF